MEEGKELIEAVLTAVMAVMVGLTTASFGKTSSPVESSDGTAQARAMMFDRVIRSLVPTGERIAEASPVKRLEI